MYPQSQSFLQFSMFCVSRKGQKISHLFPTIISVLCYKLFTNVILTRPIRKREEEGVGGGPGGGGEEEGGGGKTNGLI